MVMGIVLAGGQGSRLRPLTYYFQKVMIPVGDVQKPLLEYVIRLMKYYEIKKIGILVNYKADQIINYFNSGNRFGVELAYVFDPPKDLGSGSGVALYNAIKKLDIEETMLIYYGDILSNINLGELLKFHKDHGAQITVALAKSFTVSVGVAEIEENGRITKFREKPTLEWPVNIGILAAEPSVKDVIEELLKTKKNIDISSDVIPTVIKKYGNVYGYVSDTWWYDVGSTEKFEKLKPETINEKLGFLFKEKNQKDVPKIY
ncbi:MAG: nucleotidyltransferase family protein [Candidatus Asgardarchaeia archaeon]